MKKSDLKTGDLIATKSGKYVRVYLGTEGGDIVGGETWFPLRDYSDEILFEHIGAFHEYEYDSCFMSVWRPKANIHFKESKPECFSHNLIWEFKQKTESEKQLDLVLEKLAELQKEAEQLQETIKKEKK